MERWANSRTSIQRSNSFQGRFYKDNHKILNENKKAYGIGKRKNEQSYKNIGKIK